MTASLSGPRAWVSSHFPVQCRDAVGCPAVMRSNLALPRSGARKGQCTATDRRMRLRQAHLDADARGRSTSPGLSRRCAHAALRLDVLVQSK